MKIRLYKNGKEKIYQSKFVSTRCLRNAFKLSKTVENGVDEKLFEEIAGFLVEIYGHQFTIDELLDGLPADEFITKITDDINEIVGGFGDAVKN